MFDFAQNQTHFCTTTITHQKLLHDVRVCVDSTSVFERVNQRFRYGVFFSIRKLINCVTHCLAIVVFQSLLGAFFTSPVRYFSFKIEWHCRSDSQYWFGVCSPHINKEKQKTKPNETSAIVVKVKEEKVYSIQS